MEQQKNSELVSIKEGDKYKEWLVERRKKILGLSDDSFRRILLELHDDYAVEYMLTKYDTAPFGNG